MTRTLTLLAISLLFVQARSQSDYVYRVVQVDGGTDNASVAVDVNGDGKAAVKITGPGLKAGRWTGTAYQPLKDAGFDGGDSFGIGPTGIVAGAMRNGGSNFWPAFAASSSTDLTWLGTLPFFTGGHFKAANSSGTLVGEVLLGSDLRGVTNGTNGLEEMALYSGYSAASAWSINDTGIAVGWVGTFQTYDQACYWISGLTSSPTLIDAGTGYRAFARDINSSSVVVGERLKDGPFGEPLSAWRYDIGGSVGFQTLTGSGAAGAAVSVSDSGRIIGKDSAGYAWVWYGNTSSTNVGEVLDLAAFLEPGSPTVQQFTGVANDPNDVGRAYFSGSATISAAERAVVIRPNDDLATGMRWHRVGPASVTLVMGSYVTSSSTATADVAKPDVVRLEAQSEPAVPLGGLPPMVLDFETTLPDIEPSALAFKLTAKRVSSGTFQTAVQLWDWQASDWIDFTVSPNSLQSRYLTADILVPANEVGYYREYGTGKVKARVKVSLTGGGGAVETAWNIAFDQASFLYKN